MEKTVQFFIACTFLDTFLLSLDDFDVDDRLEA